MVRLYLKRCDDGKITCQQMIPKRSRELLRMERRHHFFEILEKKIYFWCFMAQEWWHVLECHGVLFDASFAHRVSQQFERIYCCQCTRIFGSFWTILDRMSYVSTRTTNWTRISPNDSQKKMIWEKQFVAFSKKVFFFNLP